MRQEELIESKELREELIDRVEVLEKVKQLLLIPQTEVATVKQVAAFYGVNEKTLENVYIRHKNELKEDGMRTQGCKELLNLQVEGLVQTHINQGKIQDSDVPRIESTQTKKIIYYANGDIVEVPNRGLKVFPRRAILRIGMLLRDSEVAKEIRTQLLNIEENISPEEKTKEIESEEALMIAVGMAMASGNLVALAEASTKLMSYKNRHIESLESTNKALANGILEWEDRSRLNFAVRKLAYEAHIPYGEAWNELYRQLRNKYHIDLKNRKRKNNSQPYISLVREKEWEKVIKTFAAICQYYNLHPETMFHDLAVN